MSVGQDIRWRAWRQIGLGLILIVSPIIKETPTYCPVARQRWISGDGYWRSGSLALDELIIAGKGIAASVIGCAAKDITFEAQFRALQVPKKPMGWDDIASHSNADGGLSVLGEFCRPM